MTSWDPHQGRWVDDPPGRGSPWSRTTAVIVLAALLGGGAGFGVWTLSRDDGTTRTTSTDSATSTPSPSVSAAGPEDGGNTGPATPKQSDTDTDTDTDTDSDPGGASGYVHSDDPAGFTVDVPSG